MTEEEKRAIVEEAEKNQPDIWSDEYFPYWEKVCAQFEDVVKEEADMKRRSEWLDEAENFIYEMKAAGRENEINLETVLEEVKAGWSEDVNYDGTPEEYATELFGYIEELM